MRMFADERNESYPLSGSAILCGGRDLFMAVGSGQRGWTEQIIGYHQGAGAWSARLPEEFAAHRSERCQHGVGPFVGGEQEPPVGNIFAMVLSGPNIFAAISPKDHATGHMPMFFGNAIK